jgi:heterodisulfide reductase subunit C
MAKDFGYTISKPRAILYDGSRLDKVRDLIDFEQTLGACIGCGSCTATCTAGALTAFNIRKVQTLFRRGEFFSLRTELDKCMLCGKCRMVCPRGINTRKMIVALKRICIELENME